MGQPEILEWLQARDGWYTVDGIAEGLGQSRTSVATCLKKLRRDGLVRYQKGLGPNGRRYVYARL